MADSESAEEAMEGTGLPKKYDLIWDSRRDFMNDGSRSTQPPDLVNLTTDIRSSGAAVGLEVGLLS